MSPAITSRKRQLDSFFSRATASSNSEEVRSDLSRYGIILVCGFVERSVELVILDRIQKKAHPRVRNFVRGHFKRGTNYDCEAIRQLLERFDNAWSENFKMLAGERDDVIQAVSSAYALRNSIAHGGNANLGLKGVLELYKAAQTIVDGMCVATT